MEQLQKSNHVQVLIVKDKAYWIYDYVLYEAGVHKGGEVLADEAKPVDVFSMKTKDLEEIIKIVDQINE